LSTDELLSLTVGELNKKMKNVNVSQVKEVKQLRRTLKNRGYAAICRNKRVEQIGKLEAEKKSLQKEISTLKQEKN
ncbi:hypothetical protein HELRODRAFT_136669, partial [Helobdella robusta]|uniref:Basic leucine zipper domain-containing protein n=1 Tax=Helobdella robusta TaxID=6412 RepID=T1EIF1_HELRO